MESPGQFLRDLEEGENGRFTVENRAGRALLTIFPPGAKGRPVRWTDVLARFELFHVEDFDPDEIRELLEYPDGRTHDVGSWNLPDPVDAAIHVELAEDLMSARLEVEPPRYGGSWVSREDLHRALEEKGIVAGILEEELERLVGMGGFRESSLESEEGDRITTGPPRRRVSAFVARGQLPGGGNDGRIQHRFNPHPRARPELESGEASGRIDFRSLNVIQHCEAGELLAEILAPSTGVEGYNIKGGKLAPPPPVVATLEEGKNTKLSEDGRTLVALLAGHVKVHELGSPHHARIDVEEILELDRVDYSTGHIEFPGTVVIHDTVLDGFHVRATGDILVEKSVGNVHLDTKEGDIVLYQGIVSRGEGWIRSGGDIYAKFAENASLYADGNIFIEEVAMHSRITAGGDVILETGRGELIGGSVICARQLRTKKIGARAGTYTSINVGLDPSTLEKLRSLEEDYEEKRSTLRRAEQHMRQIEEARKRGRKLPPEEEQNYEKLRLIQEKFQAMLKSLDRQRVKIYDEIEPNPDSSVEALEALYPGVEVSFGAGLRKYKVESQPRFKYCRFILEGDSVVLRHSLL